MINTSPNKAPICTDCNIQMVERVRRKDGRKFYGCKNFPECKNSERHEDYEIIEHDEDYSPYFSDF